MKIALIFLAVLSMGCTPVPTVKEEPKSESNGPTLAPSSKACKRAIKPIIVAVIDTGFGIQEKGKNDPRLCKFGHKNFADNLNSDKFGTKDKIPLDTHGHGTNIVGVIEKYAGDANYCIVVLKYYNPDHDNGAATAKAIRYAINIGATVINYSGGGDEKNTTESELVKKFIDNGGTVVAAAGNEKRDIDKKEGYYYPASSDPRIVVVGNATKFDQEKYDKLKDENKEKKMVYVDRNVAFASKLSNWGFRVNFWEYGEDVEGYGITMTGTSQATAIRTGKIVKELGCGK